MSMGCQQDLWQPHSLRRLRFAPVLFLQFPATVTRAYRRVGVELPSSTERRRLRRIGYSAAHSASFATVFMLRAVPDLAARIFSFDFAMPFP